MAFLRNLERFYGTGERNKAGENLEEFLGKYDPKKYDCPSNTVDMAVFRCAEKYETWGQPLKLLMIRRGNHPSIGYWALPGGFVEIREDMDHAAARELEEETGVKGLPLQQLCTWGSYDRDPRWRVITTSYLALVEGDLPVKAGDDAADALWMDVTLEKEQEHEAAENGSREEIWCLTLEHGEHSVALSARVKLSYRTFGILPQEKYELLESSGIAVDHGCIIIQALLYLRKTASGKEKQKMR